MGIACVVLLVLGIGTALGHDARYETDVKITAYVENQSFLGKVRAERRACKRKRLITLWKKNPGAMDGPFGTARSNKNGIWAVSSPNAPSGRYYATAKRRVILRAGHRHVCKFGRSPVFRL